MCCCLMTKICCCFTLLSRVGALGRVPQSPRNLQSVRLMAASPHADLEAAMVRRQHPHMAGQQAAALGGAVLSVLCCAPPRGVWQGCRQAKKPCPCACLGKVCSEARPPISCMLPTMHCLRLSSSTLPCALPALPYRFLTHVGLNSNLDILTPHFK